MIQAQFIKLRRTPFSWYLAITTIGIISMFVLYNMIYAWKPLGERLQLLYEVYGAFLPLLHGMTVFFLINPEEKMANMYQLLSVRRRIRMFLSLTFIVWVIETMRLILTFAAVGIQTGIALTGKDILLFIIGEALLSVISILFHLWVNLKFGVALSMFFATLEVLQSVMYSNITIVGGWRYLPTAWAMEWKSDVVNQTWNTQLFFWGKCMMLILLAIVIFSTWFKRWEGRKK